MIQILVAANFWAIGITFGFGYVTLRCILIQIDENEDELNKKQLLY